MPIQISCPQPTCRKVLLVPDAGVGKAIRCPHCQKVFQADALPSATLSLQPARSAPRRVWKAAANDPLAYLS